MGLCESAPEVVQIDLELLSKAPSGDEAKLSGAVDTLLKSGAKNLDSLVAYKGAAALCQIAMRNPSEETEGAALSELIGCVNNIQAFYVWKSELCNLLPKLMDELVDPESLEEHPALATQLFRLLEYVVGFDSVRMFKSTMSNDISFYRRLAPKFPDHPDVTVDPDQVSSMSMFTAEHTPMMNALVSCCTDLKTAPDTLAITANSLCHALRTNRELGEKRRLIAFAMTGAIVLYDHIWPSGVFNGSAIKAKPCVQVLQADSQLDAADKNTLLNGIHFSTRTYRNAPSSIQNLFE
jgi:hypothetical protein